MAHALKDSPGATIGREMLNQPFEIVVGDTQLLLNADTM